MRLGIVGLFIMGVLISGCAEEKTATVEAIEPEKEIIFSYLVCDYHSLNTRIDWTTKEEHHLRIGKGVNGTDSPLSHEGYFFFTSVGPDYRYLSPPSEYDLISTSDITIKVLWFEKWVDTAGKVPKFNLVIERDTLSLEKTDGGREFDWDKTWQNPTKQECRLSSEEVFVARRLEVTNKLKERAERKERQKQEQINERMKNKKI